MGIPSGRRSETRKIALLERRHAPYQPPRQTRFANSGRGAAQLTSQPSIDRLKSSPKPSIPLTAQGESHVKIDENDQIPCFDRSPPWTRFSPRAGNHGNTLEFHSFVTESQGKSSLAAANVCRETTCAVHQKFLKKGFEGMEAT
jgi:hypothetical protein